MSELKQVKVDNWGIYFLQRLKHFFNRTDYCDLTLQFQDNAQLKVHRLVLSACTEYFELLERTCEMYEDCLVMPDDLQADVVVPIINFMYTGQLEFKIDLLERLYQTSLIMNMPVLTKLLGSHRSQSQQQRVISNNYYGKRYVKHSKAVPSSSSTSSKRPFSSAFGNNEAPKAKKPFTHSNSISKTELLSKNSSQDSGTSNLKFPIFTEKNKHGIGKESRPTRYELPEELDEDNIFDNSFTNISYTSKPLMIHPETTKQYRSKRISLFEEGSSSSRFMHGSSNDIVECKKISVSDTMFLDEPADMITSENDIFHQSPHHKEEIKDSNQLFDQIIENDISNITIETKNKQSGNLDHAKIISEVLKKYPHLVKSNKHIKLKILNTAGNKTKKVRTNGNEGKEVKVKTEPPDFTYETDVIDSKQAARLIALGPENIKGPWICLICGTPGKALHFTSYYNFRKHLVDVHNEKPSPNICEYCGLKSQKRNYLVYHQLTKHNVEPPPPYSFPKCNYCKYVALNEALLVKHKLSHGDLRNFKRNISTPAFTSAAASLDSIQKNSKKQPMLRKGFDCSYCLKVFFRESNLYAHLKIHHKEAAKNDGLIEDSEEETMEEEEKVTFKSKPDISNFIKMEVPISYDDLYEDNNIQYQIEKRQDGNIHLIPKKPLVVMPATKHKILNPGFATQHQTLPSMQRQKNISTSPQKRNEFIQDISLSPPSNVNNEEIVVIDNNEYVVRDNQLFLKKEKITEFLIPSVEDKETIETILPTTSVEFHNIHNQNSDTKMFIKKSTDLNQPLQIVVSNEEEYKALINSNQSVIFDEGVSGDTLAVLTAPNASTLETTAIDLDNTQSNEMMIIPEDFPISVSQAVAADNSNIVVVYSHPVEDQNKQYQLIATQEVGAEFVPSSAILTQNYETVTTCTPVVSAHTTVESWPAHIRASIEKLPANSVVELQTMTISESVPVAPETVSSNLKEFPEVTLTTSVSEPMCINAENVIIETQDQTIDNNFNESNDVSNIAQNNMKESLCQNPIIPLEPIVVNNIDQQNNIVNMEQQSTVANIIDPPSIDDNNIIQQNIFDHNIDQRSRDGCPVKTLPGNIDQSTEVSVIKTSIAVVEQQSLGTDNLKEIRPNNLVPVIVEPNPESSNPTGSDSGNVMDAINPVDTTESILNTDCANPEIFEVDNLQHNPSVECEQVTDIPAEVQEIENVETLEQSHDDIEEDETIENIARDIGVDPNTYDKLETPEDSQQLSESTDGTLKEVANEQIATLTSEWSEDESEIAVVVSNNTINPDPIKDIEESVEVEESIENIQQEVKRHSVEIETDTYSMGSQNDNLILEEQQTDTKILEEQQTDTKSNENLPITSKDKISSLLNDWDDNDSQEEEIMTTSNTVEEPVQELENNEEKVVNNDGDKEDLTKNDKIKSLVSDWDEDDEDNKVFE